jgi:hypothetical protein
VQLSDTASGVHAILVDAIGDDTRESGLQKVGTWSVR